MVRAQSVPGTRKTTLRAQTTNNTSASNRFHGMPNGNVPASHISKLPLRSLLYPGAATKIYARVVPFFLPSQNHVNIGYRSDDPKQGRKQIEDMMSRGIDGAIVDWYGTANEDLGRTAVLYQQEAEQHPGFTFAISEDKGALKRCARNPGCDLTRRLVDDLNYAYDHFEQSPAYLQQDGRPIVFFFDVNERSINWSEVRELVRGNPLFVFRNKGGFALPQSDGAFAWVDQTHDPVMPSLDEFYRKALNVTGSREALVFGSVFKGFDDRTASWSENRVMDQQCGQTWLDTFARVNRYFSDLHPLDYLQVVTWNDYEEGTAIESGIENCVAV